MAITYFHINQSLKKIQLLRRRYLQQQLEALKLHPSQLPILEYINRHEECTQVEISEDLALTPAAIALATKRMQQEKLLEKRADENNLRRKRLRLTETGRKVCEKSREIFDRFDQNMFRGMTEEELKIFQSYLDRITMNITGEKTNEINFKIISSLMRQVMDEGHPDKRSDERQQEKKVSETDLSNT